MEIQKFGAEKTNQKTNNKLRKLIINNKIFNTVSGCKINLQKPIDFLNTNINQFENIIKRKYQKTDKVLRNKEQKIRKI